MSNHNKKAIAVITGLWLLLGVISLADAQPTTTAPVARPVAARPMAVPAPRPVPRRVVAAPVMKRVAPKPVVAKPAPIAPVMAAAPVMAPVAAVPAPAAMQPEAVVPTTEKKAPTVVKKDGTGSVIGGWALQIVLYLLGMFLAAFIPVFTAWLYKKFKITNLQHKDYIDSMVLKGIDLGIGKANEEAHKLRDNPEAKVKKLDIAIGTANKYLVDSGLPKKGADYLATMIEARLGVARLDVVKPVAEPKSEDAVEPKPEEDEKEDKKKEKSAEATSK